MLEGVFIMKIYVVGSSKNNFLPLDNIREKFLIDQKHDGDNIDFLNPWYCELTGLYYLWKHCDDDILGLEHYRTYFWSDIENRPMNEIEISENLKNGDIIVSGYQFPFPGRGFSPYLKVELNKCVKGTLPLFLNVLKRYDNGFGDYFTTFIENSRLYSFNCFVGPKNILNEWADFLFNVLVEFEKISKIGPGTDTLRREGYFAEYMFGAWLEYNGYIPVIKTIKKFDKNVRQMCFNVRGPDYRI